MEMKIFLLGFLIFHTSAANSFIINRVEGVDGIVNRVDFDLYGNIYARITVSDNNYKLIKINSSKKVLWTVDFPKDFIFPTLTFINNQEEVFLNAYSAEEQANVVLTIKSEGFERYDSQHNGLIIAADYVKYNLFYNRDDGVQVIRPNSTTPTPVKYLENFKVTTIEFDQMGNVYLGVRSDAILINGFVLLTKEALQAGIPYAKFIKILDDNYNQVVEDIAIDEENNVWVFIANHVDNKGNIKKISNGIAEIVFTDEVHPTIIGMFAKDKMYILAANSYEASNPSISYVTLDNKVIEIPELKNLSTQYLQMWNMLADKDGYAYFKTWQRWSSSLGSLFVVKPNEMKPIPISLPNYILNDIVLDLKDNLWIVTDGAGFYYLKKDSTEAKLVTFPLNYCWAEIEINVNKVTKEIFASCFDGLYTIAYEN